MNYVQFNSEKKYVQDFISLSKRLYKKDNTESSKEIKSILKGRHPLCKYFRLYKYLVYDKSMVVGRFAITIYPNDDTAYIGFFECINNKEVAKFIFDIARKFAISDTFIAQNGRNGRFWNAVGEGAAPFAPEDSRCAF